MCLLFTTYLTHSRLVGCVYQYSFMDFMSVWCLVPVEENRIDSIIQRNILSVFSIIL